MNSSLARKEIMPDNDELRFIKGRIAEAELFQSRIKNAQTYFESALRDIKAFDERNGTEYAAQFEEVLTDSPARTTAILLEVVAKNDGKLTKDELISACRVKGLGRGRTEGKKRGSIGAAIEKLLHPNSKRLVMKKDGRISLP